MPAPLFNYDLDSMGESGHQIDRLSIRARPPGWPIMYQNWGKLLFMHWPISETELRPLVPRRLAVDTFESSAWISITPFTMWGVRPAFLPAMPGLSAFHELNVRTYVHLGGVPGVWFFSLDTNSTLAVLGARAAFHLPYFRARMGLGQEGQRIHFSSKRTHRRAPPAEFEAVWTCGERLRESEPGSLEFFLTERYCLYAAGGGQLYRARISHPPWPLQQARLLSCHSTMLEAQGIPPPANEPLLQYAESLRVGIWPPVKVGPSAGD